MGLIVPLIFGIEGNLRRTLVVLTDVSCKEGEEVEEAIVGPIYFVDKLSDLRD
jgi:hypothetical protein